MNNLNADRIGQLVVEALERTAFVLADPVPADYAESLPVPDRFSKVDFSGAAVGSVVLSASEGFVRELASSLLGVEPDEVEPDCDGQDALNELANIVGGSVILELGGAEKEYHYGLPCTMSPNEVPDDTPGTVRSYLEAEGELLCVAWTPQDAVNSAAA